MNDYFLNLNSTNNTKLLKGMYQYAKANDVPIISDEGLIYLLQLIRLTNAKKILEVGTAIGYSAIQMASISKDIHIDTIERDIDSYNIAISNINKAKLNDNIHVVLKDGLDVTKMDLMGIASYEYDLIFIDAAKAQYKNFFNLFTPYLKKGGIVVCDNLLFHGLVGLSAEDKEKNITTKNLKGLVRKIEEFNDWLSKQKGYKTDFLKIGDGMSVSTKL